MAPKNKPSTSDSSLESLTADFVSWEFVINGIFEDLAGTKSDPPMAQLDSEMLDQLIGDATDIQKNTQTFFRSMTILVEDADSLEKHQKDAFNLRRRAIQAVYDLRAYKRTLPMSASSSQSTSSGSSLTTKLPRLEIKPFDGNILEWTTFKDCFVSAIHNNSSLSKVEKFNYLRTYLKGEAERLTSAFSLSDANYDIAWKQLQDRYEHPRKHVQIILETFMNEPNSTGDGRSIHALTDAAVNCKRRLEMAGLASCVCDELWLSHILVNKLDRESRRQWELSLKDRNTQKFESIIEFLNCRASALEDTLPPNEVHYNGSPQSHHRDDKPAFRFHCGLGCSDSHPTFKCEMFQQADVNKRRKLVSEHTLCYNCLRTGHSVKQCRSKSTCRHCKGNHHSMLHFEEATNQATTYNTAEAGGYSLNENRE